MHRGHHLVSRLVIDRDSASRQVQQQQRQKPASGNAPRMSTKQSIFMSPSSLPPLPFSARSRAVSLAVSTAGVFHNSQNSHRIIASERPKEAATTAVASAIPTVPAELDSTKRSWMRVRTRVQDKNAPLWIRGAKPKRDSPIAQALNLNDLKSCLTSRKGRMVVSISSNQNARRHQIDQDLASLSRRHASKRLRSSKTSRSTACAASRLLDTALLPTQSPSLMTAGIAATVNRLTSMYEQGSLADLPFEKQKTSRMDDPVARLSLANSALSQAMPSCRTGPLGDITQLSARCQLRKADTADIVAVSLLKATGSSIVEAAVYRSMKLKPPSTINGASQSIDTSPTVVAAAKGVESFADSAVESMVTDTGGVSSKTTITQLFDRYRKRGLLGRRTHELSAILPAASSVPAAAVAAQSSLSTAAGARTVSVG